MTSIPAQSHYIVRDAIKLHHLDWGNHGRHPLVLVHGSRLHAHVWNHFSRRFSDRYHIIAVDLRGHGDSGWAAQHGYQMENFYQDLHAVVEARGLSRFTLIGHSLGGRVSMLYAHRHADLLERLVLVDITPGRPAVAAAGEVADDSRTAPGEFDSPEAALAHLKRLMSRAPDPFDRRKRAPRPAPDRQRALHLEIRSRFSQRTQVKVHCRGFVERGEIHSHTDAAP